MIDLSILSELDTSLDLESLRAKSIRERGIDPQAIYDLHTGRQIGLLEEDELIFAAEEIDYESEDSLLDGLIERTIAAMRPSICLNRPDRVTLTNLMVKRPVDCLAFLVNRYHANRKTLVERGRDTTAFLHDRIMMYKRLARLDDAGVDLTPWIHWLLELDSKCNLHDLTPALFTLDRLGRWARVNRDGISVFWLLDELNSKDLLKVFESWVFEQLEKFDARDQQLLKESQWFRGNTHSQPAFVRSYLENPEIASRKHAEQLKKMKSAQMAKKMGRPVSEKTKAKQASVSQALDALESILNGAQQPVMIQPKPKPTLKPNLASLLGKLNKESAE